MITASFKNAFFCVVNGLRSKNESRKIQLLNIKFFFFIFVFFSFFSVIKWILMFLQIFFQFFSFCILVFLSYPFCPIFPFTWFLLCLAFSRLFSSEPSPVNPSCLSLGFVVAQMLPLHLSACFSSLVIEFFVFGIIVLHSCLLFLGMFIELANFLYSASYTT